MKQHIGNGVKITMLASLLSAVTVPFSLVHAADQPVFVPASTILDNSAPAQPVVLSAPVQPVILSNPTQAQQPANGPLRVVIPNIKPETPVATGNSGIAPSDPIIVAPAGTPAPMISVAPAPVIQAPIAAAPQAAPSPSKFKQISRNVADAAQEVWYNGVSLAEMSGEFLVQKILRPNIPFMPVPNQWALNPPQPVNQQVASMPVNQQVAAVMPAQQDPAAMAELAPAAGGAQRVVPPVVPIVPQPENEVSMPMADVTEPAPTLSSQSKSILSKAPSNVYDKTPEPPFKGKVDIARQKENATVIDNKPADKTESLGIKQGGSKNAFNVNYELERAYNALVAGQSDVAMQIYEDILTSHPNNKDALFGLATTYHRAGQIDMARSLYGKLLQIDPKHRDGLNNFLVLLSDEAPQEALGQMERLEAQNPGFSPIPAQMAIIYQKLGDREKAIDKMYRALSISPENMTYRYNLAIMLDKAGRYDQAAQLYSQLLDASAKGQTIPGNPEKIQQRLTFIRSNTLK